MMKFRYCVIDVLIIFFTGIGLGKGTGDAVTHSPYDLSLNAFYVSIATQPPSITNFTPQIGHTGTPVTITGQNFLGATNVTFNGVDVVSFLATTFNITTTVPPGASTGPITVINPNGSASTVTNFIVDNTPPNAPVLTGTNPASPSNNATPLVQGTTEPNATITIYKSGDCSGSPASTAFANNAGNFSVGVSVALNSTTTFTAIATDQAGNSSFCSSSITYVHDNIAPSAPVLLGTTPASPSNNNTAPVVHGTAEAHSIVKLYLSGSCSGSSVGTAVADNSGNFSIPISVPSNSASTITANAADTIGNVSSCSAGIPYVHDNISPAPPTLTGTSPVSPSNNNAPHILGSSEPGALIALYTDPSCLLSAVGNGVANGSGLFSIAVSVADNSTTTFYAHATDTAGNVSTCTVSGITYIENSNLPTTSICLSNYFDKNHNQQMDVGELPMDNVQFNLIGLNPLNVFSGNTNGVGKLCFNNIPPDDYTLTQVIPSGYVVSVPKAGFYAFTITGSEQDSVVWLNAASYTDSAFRTATVEQWALAIDQAGKHKSVKCKPDKVDFVFNLQYRMGIVKLKFPMFTSGVGRVGKNNLSLPVATWDNVKEATFDLTALNAAGQVIEFTGRGFKGKPISLTYQWTTSTGAVIDKGSLPAKPSLPEDSIKINYPRLPMPNLYNIGEDLERKGVFPIIIGAANGAHSVIHPKFKDVIKSFVKFGKSGPIFHSDSMSCIGNFLNGNKPILKQQKSLPPDKANSKLFAEVLALKLNIIASQKGQFPVGLDTLVYDYESVEPGNPLNGKTVLQICVQADSILDCASDPKGLHLLPIDYYDVVHRINNAFGSDVVDTVSWSCGKLILKGVRPLKSVPFLFARPGSIHGVTVPFILESYQAPETYTLAQNYPNPFNPTTTIQFELPEPAVVTLKIYNMLGQEITTLFDEQAMDDGVQEVEFDASGLTSGVYFYRIVAQGVSDPDEGTIGKRFVEVKKMLLIK